MKLKQILAVMIFSVSLVGCLGSFNSPLDDSMDEVGRIRLTSLCGSNFEDYSSESSRCVNEYKSIANAINKYIDKRNKEGYERKDLYCLNSLLPLEAKINKLNFHLKKDEQIELRNVTEYCSKRSKIISKEKFGWEVSSAVDKITDKKEVIAYSEYEKGKLFIQLNCEKKKPLMSISGIVFGVPGSYHKVQIRVDKNPTHQKQMRLYSDSYKMGYITNIKLIIKEMLQGKSLYIRAQGFDQIKDSNISLYGAEASIREALKTCY
ncbi:MAG: hypothetical protein KGV48_001255 [Alcaligenaceae bacterium]|nr:hypothetical protein [Alcaligenaceae bacterium]